MITIRASQVRALEAALFLERLKRLLSVYFPQRKAILGLDFSRAVADGVKRARAHGFETTDELSKYVMLEFALHPAFDQDPALPWAAELLSASDVPTSAMKMELLLDRALDVMQASAPAQADLGGQEVDRPSENKA